MNTSFPQASAEERGIMFSDSSLPSSWWELYNEKTGRYYWNAVTDVTQYEKPSCLAPQGGTVSGQHIDNANLMRPFYLKYMQAFDAAAASEKATPPAGTLMEGSGALNILPTKEAHVPSLYLSFILPDGVVKWHYLNLGGKWEEKVVDESGLKPELITTFLEELSEDWLATSVAVNSSIYRSFTRRNKFSSTSWLQLIDIESRVSMFKSYHEEFMLAKARLRPWVVHMGGKIYVVGADCKSCLFPPHEINGIEVFTPGESSLETLPLISTKLKDWFTYFVVAVEDYGKLVFGTGDMRLFLYDVGTHHLEKIDLHHWIPWCSKLPPVAVGRILFLFFGATIFAFDLVDRSYWFGMINGLDPSFFQDSCVQDEDPRLIYLGGGKLCLIFHDKNTSTLTCCLFNVPEFRDRSLHGQVHSVYTFVIKDTHSLSDVLLI